MSSDIVENAVGGLIASEVHGVIGMVVARIKEEIQLAWGFKASLEELEGQFTRLSGLLQGASRQPITNPLMADWLNKIKNAAHDADDLLDEWSYEALRYGVQRRRRDKLMHRVVTHSFSRLAMAHKVMGMRRLIGGIYNDAKELGIKPISVAAGNVYNAAVGPHDNQKQWLVYRRQCASDEILIGRDKDVSYLVGLLCGPTNCSSRITVIGIVGLAGLGKTTLSKRVSKVQEVTKIFDGLAIWLVISYNFDLMDTLNRMVEIMFKTTEKFQDRQAIILKLQEKLKGKRYLLILDDVWDTTDWDSLKSTLMEIGGSQGTTLLVTSRNKNVVAKMETYHHDSEGEITIKRPIMHLLQGLSKNDSWSLFMARIGDDDYNFAGSEKELIAKRIIKNCGGVPLAIKALGDLLRGKGIGKWREIENSDLWKEKDEYGILPSLKLSYNYLPNMTLKKCFSYCAIFGEDEDIIKEKLIYMWMAHGFLQPYEEMEVKGEEYFNVLVNSSLFQEAKMDEYKNVMTFKMHDLVLSLARVISKSECLCLSENSGSSDEVRHLSITNNCDFEEKRSLTFDNAKLRTYRNKQDIERFSFLLDCSNLRVLAFKWDPCLELKVLGNLKHLRYLEISNAIMQVGFRYIQLHLPKQINRLYHLQTLWITVPHVKGMTRYHEIEVLPSLISSFFPKEIGNLVSLRHIYCENGTIGIPFGLGGLSSLETLPIINLEQQWGGRISELRLLKSLRGTLEIHGLSCYRQGEEDALRPVLKNKLNLDKLVLKKIGEVDDRIVEALEPHSNLKMLEVHGYVGMRLPNWLIDRVSPLYNLISLKIDKCHFAKGNLLNLDNFRNLNHLSLRFCSNLSIISFPNDISRCCRQLEILEIVGCRNIAQTEHELVWLGSLPHLRRLETDLLLPRDLGKDSPICTSLEMLTLHSFDGTNTLPVSLQQLVSLQCLEIDGFEHLEALPDWLCKLTSLRDLQLRFLPELRSLPSQEAMQCLSHLDTLTVEECPILSQNLRNKGEEWDKTTLISHVYWD